MRGVVLAVKPLSFSPRLIRFLRREFTLSSQDISDKLLAEEVTLFFSTILLAPITSFSSILAFFFRPFFFGISVAGRDVDCSSGIALRLCFDLSVWGFSSGTG